MAPHDRAAADAGERSTHLLSRVPADDSEANRAGVDGRDPYLPLRLRRAPAEEVQANDRGDAEAGDRSSHFLPRAPAEEEAEAHDRAVPEAGGPSCSLRLRRAPAEEAEAHDRRDADASDLLLRAPAEKSVPHDRLDADAGGSSSSLLRRALAVNAKADEAGCCRRENGIVGDTRQPVKPAAASDTGAQRGGRPEKGIGGDTSLPPNPAAEAGEHCGAVQDHPHAQHSLGNPSSLPTQNRQATTSSISLGARHIDPNHVYELYRGGQLKRLLKYMDSFPGAVNDYYYRIIKELIYISMRGDIPDHLDFEWNAKRAESARDLAGRIDRSYASLQGALTSTQVLICAAEPCQRPSNNMSTTTSKGSNDGQIMQKIPLVSGFLERSGCLLPNVKGINPLRFHSPHPVWGEHAIPVEKSNDTKVKSFFCMYCEKELTGNAKHAVYHMKHSCKIPLHVLNNLLDEVDQYQERREQLMSAKRNSKAKGRKAGIANDGVTILPKSDVVKITELVGELSQGEEYSPLDGGTAGVLAMTQLLFMQAQKHLLDGSELIKIIEHYEMASRMACVHLDHISVNIIFSATDKEPLVSTCTAALPMNIVDSYKLELANVAVEAVLKVADWQRKEVNLKLIQVKGKLGRKQIAELVHGIVVDKQMSHQQMPKRIEGAKIALLSFESSNIDSVEASRQFRDEQEKYAEEIIQKCQDIGATLVICQWSFDEKVSHLLMQRKLTAVRGVSDVELKEIANATGGQVVQKIQDLCLDKLGEAKLVREKQIGKTKGRVLYIESYASPAPVTIFFQAGSNIVLEDIMRKLADALCVLRSLIIENTFVYGGGSAEISCSLALHAAADTYPGYARPFIKSFIHALDAIPLELAGNTGLLPIDMLTTLKSRHLNEKNSYFGIHCNGHEIADMKEQHVFASLKGKKKQILLALKVLKIMLKVDAIT